MPAACIDGLKVCSLARKRIGTKRSETVHGMASHSSVEFRGRHTVSSNDKGSIFIDREQNVGQKDNTV